MCNREDTRTLPGCSDTHTYLGGVQGLGFRVTSKEFTKGYLDTFSYGWGKTNNEVLPKSSRRLPRPKKCLGFRVEGELLILISERSGLGFRGFV